MLPRAQPLPTHAEPSDPEVGFTWFAEISARVVHTSCREHLRSLPASGCGMLRAIIPKNAEGAQFLLLDMHVALKRRPSRRSGHFERDAALPVLTSCCYGPHEHRCACQRLMPHPGGREWLAHVECPCRMVPNSRSMPRLSAQSPGPSPHGPTQTAPNRTCAARRIRERGLSTEAASFLRLLARHRTAKAHFANQKDTGRTTQQQG